MFFYENIDNDLYYIITFFYENIFYDEGDHAKLPKNIIKCHFYNK